MWHLYLIPQAVGQLIYLQTPARKQCVCWSQLHLGHRRSSVLFGTAQGIIILHSALCQGPKRAELGLKVQIQ